jgi:hypothetical protein
VSGSTWSRPSTGTDLDEVLSSNGVETLVLAGFATSGGTLFDRPARSRRLPAPCQQLEVPTNLGGSGVASWTMVPR